MFLKTAITDTSVTLDAKFSNTFWTQIQFLKCLKKLKTMGNAQGNSHAHCNVFLPLQQVVLDYSLVYKPTTKASRSTHRQVECGSTVWDFVHHCAPLQWCMSSHRTHTVCMASSESEWWWSHWLPCPAHATHHHHTHPVHHTESDSGKGPQCSRQHSQATCVGHSAQTDPIRWAPRSNPAWWHELAALSHYLQHIAHCVSQRQTRLTIAVSVIQPTLLTQPSWLPFKFSTSSWGLRLYLHATLSPLELAATSRSVKSGNWATCFSFSILYRHSFGLKWKNRRPFTMRRSSGRVFQSQSSCRFWLSNSTNEYLHANKHISIKRSDYTHSGTYIHWNTYLPLSRVLPWITLSLRRKLSEMRGKERTILR